MQELLKKLLKEKGVTQYAMAKATGLSKSSVTDWMKGRCKPNAAAVKKLADYFGVPMEIFIGEGEPRKESK